MTSTRPYLIRAFYDWIVDNQCTPHIVVNAGADRVEVPREYVKDGQIILNVAMTAVQGLKLGDNAVEFQARFAGQARRVYAPVKAIIAIYAKENGRGMVFAEEESDPTLPPTTEGDTEETGGDSSGGGGKGKRSGGKPHLTVVK